MTQPNPLKIKILDPLPTQPNPTHGSTQPMNNSAADRSDLLSGTSSSCITVLCYTCTLSDAETALKMMMMTGSAAAVPLAALQAAGHRQRAQQAAAAASYLTSAGLRHVAPLTALTPPAMYVLT